MLPLDFTGFHRRHCAQLLSLVTLALRAVGVVLSLALLAELVQLDNESTPLDGVDEDEAARESVMAPSTREGNDTTTHLIVILRVDVEPTDLFHVTTGRIFRNARDIENADTSTVVGKSGKAILDVEVVVDRLHLVLVVTGDLGLLEAAKVPLKEEALSDGLYIDSSGWEVIKLTMKVTGYPSAPGPRPSRSSSSSFMMANSCQFGLVTQPW